MKRNLFLYGTIAVGAMVFLANSNGVAEQQGANRTGEPGTDPTCTQCHNGGNFGTMTSIEVTHPDSTGAVSAYLPGTEYVLNITVNTSNGTAPAHGMQSTAVDANGNNAGTFSAPSSNAQLESVDGRHIFEHSQASSSNTFTATWLSPANGGDVTFYASGLAVNGNGQAFDQGDESNSAVLVLPEAQPVGTGLDELAWSSPANWNGQTWQWQAPQTGRLVVADVSGRVILAQDLGAGQDVEWDADGLRLVSFVTDEGTRQSWKLAAR